MEFKKYPKIAQFKDAMYEVRRKASFVGLDDDEQPIYRDPGVLPTLEFEGTVKLHGTNAAITFERTESGIQTGYQSRNRKLTLDSDNAGFVAWCMDPKRQELINELGGRFDEFINLYIFGEFCGGNIQGNVALNELDKMFVVFGIYADGEWYHADAAGSRLNEHGFYSTAEFPTYSKTIDFNNPAKTINEIVDLVEQVEQECPVGKHFGISGIGEGIVWKCVTPEYEHIRFKSKGEKHSNSKVKTLSPVDIKKMDKQLKMASEIMTDSRLNQGIEYLNEMERPIDRSSTGDYLGYVVSDCLEEEKHAIIAAELDRSGVGKQCGHIARVWYFDYLDRITMNFDK